MQVWFVGGPMDGANMDSDALSDPDTLRGFLDGDALEVAGVFRRSHIYRREGEPGEPDSLAPPAIVLYFQGVSTAAPGEYRGERDLYRPPPPP